MRTYSLILLLLTLSACASPPPTAPAATEAAPPSPSATPFLPQAGEAPSPEPMEVEMAFELTSSAFAHGESIPMRYSCDGEDISPPLTWGDPPAGTQSFALIMDDPDAPMGTWVHWVVYNLPAATRGLPENVPTDAQLPDGSLQGTNSWGRIGYGGPCPPSGTHRYFFKLYALDTTINLPAGAEKKALLQAMQGHVLAEAELMGTFQR